jgi:site-specific DNA-methyltransferase (adenine-specific)
MEVKVEEYLVVKPEEIRVHEDLPRLRKDMGKIKDLVESFKKFGQLQPCLVNRNMELIAGGRRWLACIDAGIDVKIVFSDTMDPLQMREMELEENIQRKAFTPAEEILAVQELHRLKQEIHGEAICGKENSGWRVEDTAAIIGKSRASVTGDLALAQALEDFPVLGNCKTKSEIKKAVKGLQRIADSFESLEKYEDAMKGKKEKFQLHNIDCIEFMKTLPDGSIDVLFTDPPYGIDIHDIQIGLGGHTGADVTTTGIKYDDSYENAMDLIGQLAIESFRFVKSNGFAMVFCAITHFNLIKTVFDAVGWNCSQRPIIWIKNESGQNNAPNKWMSAGYECMLFARRIDSQLVVEGKVDWIQFPNVVPSVRIHQAEKPVPLIKELLSRVAHPGVTVFDPFAGSAATIEACLDMKMIPIGCEKETDTFAVAKQRIYNYFKSKGELT